MTRKVRVGSVYTYDPVMLDALHPCYGAQQGYLKVGDKVRVVNQYGRPPANTMGQCYIESLGGEMFLGMVCCNSLQPTKGVK